MPEVRPGVASRLFELLTERFGTTPPITLTAWDGSRAGGDQSVLVHVRSRKAVRRLLWRPGALRVAEAYVTEQLDTEGDFARAVSVLLDYREVTARARPTQAADRREILRVAVVSGAVGPVARPPAVSLAAVDGYGFVDDEMAEVLGADLARHVLGEDRVVDGGGDGRTVLTRYVTFPDPLSALVRRWEQDRIAVEEIRRIDDDLTEDLRRWSSNLEEHWDAVQDAVGVQQTRAWRLGLVLDREHLQRGAVAAYQVRGVARVA